jgi:hypothetical protein
MNSVFIPVAFKTAFTALSVFELGRGELDIPKTIFSLKLKPQINASMRIIHKYTNIYIKVRKIYLQMV